MITNFKCKECGTERIVIRQKKSAGKTVPTWCGKCRKMVRQFISEEDEL